MIDSDDGYQAPSSPDWLAGPDPLLPFVDLDAGRQSGQSEPQVLGTVGSNANRMALATVRLDATRPIMNTTSSP